jgi:hypothetical protein
MKKSAALYVSVAMSLFPIKAFSMDDTLSVEWTEEARLEGSKDPDLIRRNRIYCYKKNCKLERMIMTQCNTFGYMNIYQEELRQEDRFTGADGESYGFSAFYYESTASEDEYKNMGDIAISRSVEKGRLVNKKSNMNIITLKASLNGYDGEHSSYVLKIAYDTKHESLRKLISVSGSYSNNQMERVDVYKLSFYKNYEYERGQSVVVNCRIAMPSIVKSANGAFPLKDYDYKGFVRKDVERKQ